uniref:Uncharacterized protein n=1 Tax=Glossina palpalis gambiensis TaxID=67801 RepID=A0A1B0C3Z8_9MUSC
MIKELQRDRPAKEFISKEKFTAHFNGLHIFSDYIQHNAGSSSGDAASITSTAVTGKSFANLTYADYQITAKDLEEKLRNVSRIMLWHGFSVMAATVNLKLNIGGNIRFKFGSSRPIIIKAKQKGHSRSVNIVSGSGLEREELLQKLCCSHYCDIVRCRLHFYWITAVLLFTRVVNPDVELTNFIRLRLKTSVKRQKRDKRLQFFSDFRFAR